MWQLSITVNNACIPLFKSALGLNLIFNTKLNYSIKVRTVKSIVFIVDGKVNHVAHTWGKIEPFWIEKSTQMLLTEVAPYVRSYFWITI